MNSHDVSETAPRKGQTKKKNFGRSTSATLLCVVYGDDKVSLLFVEMPFVWFCDQSGPLLSGLSCRITKLLGNFFWIFLDSIWRELYLRQIESFALGHRTSVFSVHPTDPPLFV